MSDHDNDMTLVLIAVDGAELQNAAEGRLMLTHPLLKRGTAMAVEVMPMRDALRSAVDRTNHDLSTALQEMRAMVGSMRRDDR